MKKPPCQAANLFSQEQHRMQQEPELTLDRNVPQDRPLDTAPKRALIEAELRKDAGRSDRKIAEAVGHGVCHKTVGAARERLGLASPLGNLAQPTSAAEAFTRAAAGEKVNFSVVKCPPPPGVVDEPKYDPFAPECPDMAIQSQPAVSVYENTAGAVVIIQESSDPHEEDPIIRVRPEHVEKLVAKLRQVAKEALS
jgi:hypothetical protein